MHLPEKVRCQRFHTCAGDVSGGTFSWGIFLLDLSGKITEKNCGSRENGIHIIPHTSHKSHRGIVSTPAHCQACRQTLEK